MSYLDCVDNLAYLHGKPQATGDYRVRVEDFEVEEVLGFEPGGGGEHVCLYIEKQGENTRYIAGQIAKIAGVRPRDVSHCGLKDRHAVTRQWFSVAIPVKKTIDWTPLQTDSCRILNTVRHNKKLRTGSHKANRFIITVRNISYPESLEQRLSKLGEQGVPNYFGAQRFGHGGHNLELAESLFNGNKIKDRPLRSMVISAARSHLFNQVVNARIEKGCFDQPLAGDVFRLAGSRAFFCEPVDDAIGERLAQQDIQIAANLPGKGGWLNQDEASVFEQQAIGKLHHWVDGLAALGVDVDCRPIALMPQSFSHQWLEPDVLRLSFTLPTGSFATAVLRELLVLTDCSEKSSNKGGDAR